jgi:hypothetical protein
MASDGAVAAAHYAVTDGGQQRYTGLWSLSRDDEKQHFEHFVDWVMERWRQHPGLHIYHFAPYEPGALKRLMGRYASREEEIDRMLRARLFVDLFAIVRHAIRAGVESYKRLEQFYGFTRAVDLSDANRAIASVQACLELAEPEGIGEEQKAAVEGYNRDDCIAGVQFVASVGGTAKAPVHRYSFPAQETDLRGGEALKSCGGEALGKLDEISFEGRTVDIKKRGNTAIGSTSPHREHAAFAFSPRVLTCSSPSAGRHGKCSSRMHSAGTERSPGVME